MSVLTSQIHEGTPLLSSSSGNKRTPIPWGQLSIIILLELVEPICLLVIAPFGPQVGQMSLLCKLEGTLVCLTFRWF